MPRYLARSTDHLKLRGLTNSTVEKKRRPEIPLLDFSNLPRASDSARAAVKVANKKKEKDAEKGSNNFDTNINFSVSINAVNSTVTTKLN